LHFYRGLRINGELAALLANPINKGAAVRSLRKKWRSRGKTPLACAIQARDDSELGLQVAMLRQLQREIPQKTGNSPSSDYVSRSFPRGTNQFTERRQIHQYHTDRWIVNKVTFYLTFC
jgi:hypothetical protein